MKKHAIIYSLATVKEETVEFERVTTRGYPLILTNSEISRFVLGRQKVGKSKMIPFWVLMRLVGVGWLGIVG